jgi:hypothetical protein
VNEDNLPNQQICFSKVWSVGLKRRFIEQQMKVPTFERITLPADFKILERRLLLPPVPPLAVASTPVVSKLEDTDSACTSTHFKT